MSSVNSGVVALQIAVATDGMRCSAYANSVNGTVLSSVAATAACAHRRGSRGNASRRTAKTAISASAPTTIRPSTICSGANASSPTLMSKKLAPQIAVNSK